MIARMCVLTADGWDTATKWEQSTSAAGLACLIKGQVPQEHEARPVDAPPELAPNCEAMISKRKRIERERIRTPRLLSGGVLRSQRSDRLTEEGIHYWFRMLKARATKDQWEFIHDLTFHDL